MQEPRPRDSLHPWAGEEGEEAGVRPLKAEVAQAVVEGEEGHTGSLVEVQLVGPRKAQQGGLGKENLG